jgi:hypothetical protein
MSKAIPVESLKRVIIYYYLLTYSPPEKIADFKEKTAAMRSAMAEKAGMQDPAFFSQALPEVCRRIVAYHQATREPDPRIVQELEAVAQGADSSPSAAASFQQEMARIAALPERAKPANRLHRNKGCRFCVAACRYGYFTLVSEPQFQELQAQIAAELKQPVTRQSPLRIALTFANQHIQRLTGKPEGLIQMEDMVNLSYCLVLLGMAKSRLPVPEKSLMMLQIANRLFIRRQTGLL